VLTDSKIKASIKRFALSDQRSLELVADGRRGAGRLVLVLRQYDVKGAGADAPKKFAVEFYARYHQLSGKRRVVKIGNYPDMTLAQATQIYAEDYAPKIARGEAVPMGIGQMRREARTGPTFKGLLDAYEAELESRNAPSLVGIRCIFRNLLKTIDPDKAPAAVTTAEIADYLAGVYSRGTQTYAHMIRAHLSAAFSFGMKSAHNYTNPSAVRDWGLTINPVAAIPRDPNAIKPGMRALSIAELVDFWRWCDTREEREQPGARAAQLLMATGQRPNEILSLGTRDTKTKGHYLADEGLLTWDTTKNRMPHCIPVPATAKRILDKMHHPNGMYFPGHGRPDCLGVTVVTRLIKRYLAEHPEVPPFVARDLRRSYKTLAGQAGLSKDIRDRLQNHAKGDVGSRHYDRWTYMPELKAATQVWDAFLAQALLRPTDADQGNANAA